MLEKYKHFLYRWLPLEVAHLVNELWPVFLRYITFDVPTG
jgi:hypothetical protein